MLLHLSRLLLIVAIVLIPVSAGVADELEVGAKGDAIQLTPERPYLHVIHDGRSVKVQRIQDPDYELKGYFAKTGRKCPPFCIKPMHAAPGVATIGELEVFEFMENELRDGEGVLIDARTPAWFEKGTIPGSINIPFTVLTQDPKSPEVQAYLEQFGGKKRNAGTLELTMEQWGVTDGKHKTKDWDFSAAKQLVLWCNGPSCGQSPRAIKGLLNAGYPADKLRYYRGGMQMWQLFGLTTVTPK
ncbi:MAG: rhodanese-like domain-containing protein [Chromatiales bacterium]|jgi:rhodanese-related sulfurtransferase